MLQQQRENIQWAQRHQPRRRGKQMVVAEKEKTRFVESKPFFGPHTHQEHAGWLP